MSIENQPANKIINIEEIPSEIIEAAKKVEYYAKQQGWKNWELCGIAERPSSPAQPASGEEAENILLRDFIDRTETHWRNCDVCRDAYADLPSRILETEAPAASKAEDAEKALGLKGELKSEAPSVGCGPDSVSASSTPQIPRASGEKLREFLAATAILAQPEEEKDL